MKIFLAAALLTLAPRAAETGGLKIENAWVEAVEDGPRVPVGYRFQPGDVVYFSFQVSGYKTEEVNFDTRKVSLSWEVTVSDPQGLALVAPAGDKTATTLSPEDRLWKPIGRRSFQLPSFVPGGRYRIHVRVRDELAQKVVEQEVEFEVAGRPWRKTDKLEVSNFRFLRTADDKEGLEVPAYAPGDTLWAKFDMTGYKMAEGNRYRLEYGVKILNSDGTTAFERTEAAAAESASFYPQRVTAGVLSVQIPRDQAKASYTLVVTVEDRIGGAQCEAREKFTVE